MNTACSSCITCKDNKGPEAKLMPDCQSNFLIKILLLAPQREVHDFGCQQHLLHLIEIRMHKCFHVLTLPLESRLDLVIGSQIRREKHNADYGKRGGLWSLEGCNSKTCNLVLDSDGAGTSSLLPVQGRTASFSSVSNTESNIDVPKTGLGALQLSLYPYTTLPFLKEIVAFSIKALQGSTTKVDGKHESETIISNLAPTTFHQPNPCIFPNIGTQEVAARAHDIAAIEYGGAGMNKVEKWQVDWSNCSSNLNTKSISIPLV
ncbi:hypothetical protein VNO77_35358 [Canavalia gladiata]|uniref:Uncharacterized protein n=1 Tax=Canavalia gladiata TaxID=3824 RepID=A0AAN9KGE5_CANGL